jgi:hypothetical protein
VRKSQRAQNESELSPLPTDTTQEITLLISEYLHSRHPRLAEAFAAEIGPARDEIDSVERAILGECELCSVRRVQACVCVCADTRLDGDFGSIESILAPGLLGPQTQKAFLYMCYREQFLEYIDNRELELELELEFGVGV